MSRNPIRLASPAVRGNSAAGSTADSDASPDTESENDGESGFIDTNVANNGVVADFVPYSTRIAPNSETGDIGAQAVKFIGHFWDVIASDISLSAEHVRQLHARLPAFVAAHIEILDQVHRESRRLPDTTKKQLMNIVLVPNEAIVIGPLRVFLLPDGRQDLLASQSRSPAATIKAKASMSPALVDTTTGILASSGDMASLLPAEGALYLTNYRVVFKGTPSDPMLTDQVVVRTMPVLAVTKAKRITPSSALLLMPSSTTGLVDAGAAKVARAFNAALQLRSSTFQLMRIAFDVEVSETTVDEFTTRLDLMRYVSEAGELFALSRMPPLNQDLHTNMSPMAKHKTIGYCTPYVGRFISVEWHGKHYCAL